MARPRAADYDGKRKAILDRSAKLFAKNGYDRTSMAEVAAACRVSKALLYHYYVNKDELLFDILKSHLEDLIGAVRAVDEKLAARKRLRALVGALLDAYKDADHQHKIQINELSKLAPAKRSQLVALERELVLIFSKAIGAVNDTVGNSPRLLKPVTMSLFGMLNWHYMWFREGGPMSREEYADLATQILVEGAASLENARPLAQRAAG
jgi:TetR/AcrR family transcriptional regulator